MTTRSLRQRPAQTPAESVNRAIPDATRDEALSCTESLLLAQAVYEFGLDWTVIAQLLQSHPLINRPKDFYNKNACQSFYKKLLGDAEMQLDEKEHGAKSKQTDLLARKHYTARVDELRELIAAEEARFKQLSLEIEEIRSGAWDDKIAKDSSGTSAKTSEATAVTDDEADSRQVQSQVVALDEASTDPVPEASHMDVDITAATTNPDEVPRVVVVEEYSSGEDIGKGRGTSRRSRAKAKSPTVRKSRRLSQVTPPPTSREDESEVKRSPLRRSSRLSTEEAEVENDGEVETTVASAAAASTRRASKRKASSVEAQAAPRDVKRAREDSEPVIIEEEEEEEEEAESSNAIRQKRAAFQQTILLLHNQFHNHRYGALFHAQVKDTDADNYKDIVKRPMDLKTIRNKVKEGTITNSDEYLRDIYLMFANALLYNAPGTSTHDHTKSMLENLQTAIHDHKMSESFNNKK